MSEQNELDLKRIWEKMAKTLPPEEVVFGPPGRRWSRMVDLETFDDLRKYLNITEKDVLLDVGCGPLARAEVQFGLRGNTIVGVDISASTLKKANETIKKLGLKDKVEFVLVDAESLPFRSDLFDIVLCIGVISHLPSMQSVERALQQIRRSLKMGGKLYTTWLLNLFSIWCVQEALKFSIMRRPDREQHLKFRGLPEINNVFKESKLEILKIRYGILLYKLTILYPHLPFFMQRKIDAISRVVNKFHREHSVFSFFSRSFEVSAQKTQMNPSKTHTKVDSFYELPF
jgi:SAM-dependent methyltransferase